MNADKVVLTGNKENAKIYTRFSGYVGGKQVDTPRKIRARRPELLLELAVKGMVPHTAWPSANDQAEGLCRRRSSS